jgi:hypothetical protein
MTARATTEVGAANLALGHFGLPEIADLSDKTTRARAVRQFFGTTRDSLLRRKWWSFAKGWVRPSADPVQSDGPLKNRFVLPDSVLRVRYIDEAADDAWDIESGAADDGGAQTESIVLVSNLTAPVICVTRRVESVRLWDPIFLEGFGYELAAACAKKLGRSANFAAGLRAQAKELIDTAAGIDSKEQSRQEITRTSSWILARRGRRSPLR